MRSGSRIRIFDKFGQEGVKSRRRFHPLRSLWGPVRGSARDYHLKNDPVGIGHYVLAINVPPLVAPWRTTEVMGLPVVDALATVPVLVAHVLSFSPVVVPNILVVVFLVVPGLVVVVFLGEGDSAGEAERQGGYSQSSQDFLHSNLRFRECSGRCQPSAAFCGPVRLTRDDYLENDAIGACQHIFAIQFAPLVAVRRTPQVMSLPVFDALSALPLVALHVLTAPPLVPARLCCMLVAAVVLIPLIAPVLILPLILAVLVLLLVAPVLVLRSVAGRAAVLVLLLIAAVLILILVLLAAAGLVLRLDAVVLVARLLIRLLVLAVLLLAGAVLILLITAVLILLLLSRAGLIARLLIAVVLLLLLLGVILVSLVALVLIVLRPGHSTGESERQSRAGQGCHSASHISFDSDAGWGVVSELQLRGWQMRGRNRNWQIA